MAKPRFADELPLLVAAIAGETPGLATGLRRSYGDSNLNPGGRVIDMTGLDRLSQVFETEGGTGRVRVLIWEGGCA